MKAARRGDIEPYIERAKVHARLRCRTVAVCARGPDDAPFYLLYLDGDQPTDVRVLRRVTSSGVVTTTEPT